MIEYNQWKYWKQAAEYLMYARPLKDRPELIIKYLTKKELTNLGKFIALRTVAPK